MVEKIRKRLSKFIDKPEKIGSETDKNIIRIGAKIIEIIYFILIIFYVVTAENRDTNTFALFLCVGGLFGICMVYTIENCLIDIFCIDDSNEAIKEDKDLYEDVDNCQENK